MFRFPPMYPIESPAVQFVVDQTHQSPVHPVCLFLHCVLLVIFTHRGGLFQHVYSNGHVRFILFLTRVYFFLAYRARRVTHLTDSLDVQICASILGTDWSPVLSVVSVCVTLQSMLASCKVRSLARSLFSDGFAERESFL